MESLSPAQRDYLLNHIQRGKRTAFANVMARLKGVTINNHDSDTLELIEQHLDGWVLVQIIDSGFINPKTRCECGKPLRYQYIVQHKKTKEILKFGINHFEQHVNLPHGVVKDVLKGFKEIDYELDELLIKIKNGVKSEKILSSLQIGLRESIPIPNNLKEQIALGLPLLENQIAMIFNARKQLLSRHSKSANKLVREYKEQQYEVQKNKRDQRQAKYRKEREVRFNNWQNEIEMDAQISDELISSYEDERELLVSKIRPYIKNNTSIYEIAFLLILNNERSLSRICSILIDYFDADSSLFKTGRPKVYAEVFLVLQQFVKTGNLVLLETSNRFDCLYVIPKKTLD
ncbi:DUF3895 domain-containing protein [Lysinibacillus sp. 1P01SD]|uniref:DUF3895 domain-containing protein n=1 Tax=Lysinibacillus sp. 1P01SD TaxID=3132285 RepID=UPI0039A3F445